MPSVDEFGGADLINDKLTKICHSLRSYTGKY